MSNQQLSILDQLRDEVERGDSWVPYSDPTHPNPLVGTVVAWDTGSSKDGTKCEICTVRDTDDKVWSVWTWHSYLRIQLLGDKDNVVPVEERPAQAGCFVAIRHLGKFPRQDGDGEVHRYRTAISPATSDSEASSNVDDIPF